MKWFFLGFAALFAFDVAQAADMPVKALIKPTPATNWTGFYVGLHAGGVSGRQSSVLDVNYNATNELVPIGSASSFLGGGQIGYNWQYSALVLGVEADISGLDYLATGQSPTGPDTNYSVKATYFGTARGRLGVAFDRTLLFVTGGVAYTDLRYAVLDTVGFPNNIPPQSPNTVSGSQRVDYGWTVGAGLEYAIASNWSVKGEYLYSRFEGKTVQGVMAAPPGALTPFVFSDTEIHIGRVGLNYRFGGPVMARY